MRGHDRADRTPGLTANGGAGQAALSWTASTDNVGVSALQRPPLDDARLHPLDREPDRAAHRHELHGHRPRRRHLLLQGHRRGRGRQPRRRLERRRPRPSAHRRRRRPRRRVRLRRGNRARRRPTSPGPATTGTLANTTWAGAAAGKFGNALTFNGTNSDRHRRRLDTSLDLTTGMTLEAWVRPTDARELEHGHLQGAAGLLRATRSTRTPARTGPSGNVYNDRRPRPPRHRPARAEHVDASRRRPTTAPCSPSTSTASRTRRCSTTGAIVTSTGALRIGGNTIWGEQFSGLIDEVRIYNRALSATEIQTDMNRPVTNPDTTPPTRTDELRRARVDPRRPSPLVDGGDGQRRRERVSALSRRRAGRNGDDERASRSRASPAARARTSRSRRATRSETSPRARPHGRDGRLRRHTAECAGTLTATGAIGRATLSWGAATDNVGVTRYNVHRGTTAGFTPSAANRIAQPTGTSYVDHGRRDLLLPCHRRGRRRATSAPPSNEASATVTADTIAPTAPTGADSDRRRPQVALTLDRGDRQRRRRALQRPPRHDGAASRRRPRTGSRSRPGRATRTLGSPPATYYYKRDRRGRRRQRRPGLERGERHGDDAAADRTRRGVRVRRGLRHERRRTLGPRQHRHASAARPGRLGKFGNALNFDGVNDWVTVADSASLDLTTGDDARGVGAARRPRQRLADGRLQGADRATSSTGSTRTTNTNVPRSEACHRRYGDGLSTAPPRFRSACGRTSRRRYDGSTCGSTSTATQVATHGGDGQHHRPRPGRSGSAATASGGEWFAGPDRRGARLQPRADAGRDPDRHEPARRRRTSRAPTVVAHDTRGRRAIDVPIDTQPTARFSEPIDRPRSARDVRAPRRVERASSRRR